MFAQLISLRSSNGLWWRIVAVIVAVVAVVAVNSLVRAKNYETIHSVADAGVVNTVSVQREQLFILVDQQHRELAVLVGETGLLRLSNAGETVTTTAAYPYNPTDGRESASNFVLAIVTAADPAASAAVGPAAQSAARYLRAHELVSDGSAVFVSASERLGQMAFCRSLCGSIG